MGAQGEPASTPNYCNWQPHPGKLIASIWTTAVQRGEQGLDQKLIGDTFIGQTKDFVRVFLPNSIPWGEGAQMGTKRQGYVFSHICRNHLCEVLPKHSVGRPKAGGVWLVLCTLPALRTRAQCNSDNHLTGGSARPRPSENILHTVDKRGCGAKLGFLGKPGFKNPKKWAVSLGGLVGANFRNSWGNALCLTRLLCHMKKN